MSEIYINVILPLAIPLETTYKVSEELASNIQIGIRVEVPLRRKLYAGLVHTILDEAPAGMTGIKEVISILDFEPIVDAKQLKVWNWMASYYCCTIGEVMNMVLPSGLKLNSETILQATDNYLHHIDALPDKEFLIAEAVSIQKDLSIDKVQEIIQQKTVYPHIRSLIDKGIIQIEEELIAKYKVKTSDFISFDDGLKTQEGFEQAIAACSRSQKQSDVLLALENMISESSEEWIDKKTLYEITGTNQSVIKALEKKGFINIERREVSRLKSYTGDQIKPSPLSPDQEVAVKEIRDIFTERDHVLLYGITGSGKTRIYIELIIEQLQQGKQILYLVPEIALTTQLIQRLQKVFGDQIGLYHSRMNNNDRVELYHMAKGSKAIFMGARSSLFLPYKDLGLIIIDEEHDPSYKQNDPAPRYNARDTAIYLSKTYGAKVLLGSATPSLETYLNALNGKFGLVKLLKRHGDAVLPEIEIVDLRKSYEAGEVRANFSKELMDGITAALANGEQVLLFQNRRGYAPTLRCNKCGWNADCPNCDLTLTVHQYFQEIRCHYCSHRENLPSSCPDCGNHKLSKLGFGTEKIEDELQSMLPAANIARMDYDTTKTKSSYERILSDFELKKIDVLVGTQMITKGLDFENISLVGILNADKSLFFPDFRASERAFQLFTQVAGRAGRRKKQGKVILQTFSPGHDVITETVTNNITKFYKRELHERNAFVYPPYYRLISLTLKHKTPVTVRETAKVLATLLKRKLGKRVLGPTQPGVARLRGMFIEQIMIKMERDGTAIKKIKEILHFCLQEIKQDKTMKSVRVIIDVDP